jgi:hypothetical protein
METSDVLEDASPRPRRPSSRPGVGMFFRGAAEEETPAPRTSTEFDPDNGLPMAESLPPAAELDGSDSGSDWPTDERSDLDESAPSSSTGSSASSLTRFSKKAAKAAIYQGILTGTTIAHRVAAKTEGQRAAGLYLADDEDAEAISDPLADIAGRRGGVAGKALSPDAADAVRAMVGLAGYMSKQIARTIAANEYDAQAPGHGPVDL